MGRTLTSRAETVSKTVAVQIVVSARDGHTHIRIEENLGQAAIGLFAGLTAGVGLGAGLPFGLFFGSALYLGSALFAVAAPLGVMGLSYMAAREIYRAVVRRRSRAMDELLDHIVQEAQTCISASTVEAPASATGLPPGD